MSTSAEFAMATQTLHPTGMTDQETLFKFLDAACLAYQGGDYPAQWAQATTMLATDPLLGTATLAGAATTGNVAALQKFLEADATCHSKQSGPRSWPPLLYLCYSRIAQQDAIESLELLLAAGADPNAHFIAWGAPFTAITGAVGQGEQGPIRLPSHPHALQLVTRLLDAGAKPNDAQALYNTMLSADTVWLSLFLARGLTAADPITWPIEGNPRSLDFVLANAVDHGDMERIELLLSHGANPNCMNTYAGLPIHTCALLGGHDAVAERLVEAGATSTGLNGAQRFARAIAMQDLDAARAMVSPEILANPQHLLSACDRGEVEIAQLLLDAGANVNGVDDQGVSPLHRAAWNDHSEVVILLLSQGADPTLREKNHNATPHAWAVHNNNAVTAELLDKH